MKRTVAPGCMAALLVSCAAGDGRTGFEVEQPPPTGRRWGLPPVHSRLKSMRLPPLQSLGLSLPYRPGKHSSVLSTMWID